MSVSYLLLLCGINKNILIYSICRRYDEMAEKVSDVPDTTEEIVGLQEYLKTVSSVEKKDILNPDYGCTVMLICLD